MAKKQKYSEGDIFSIPLDDDNIKGFGRIKKIENGLVFLELYKLKPASELNLEKLQELEPVLQVWAIDRSLKNGKWNIVGNVPIEGPVEMPDFWTTDAFTGKIMLIKDGKEFEITKEQIGNAQPSGIFGDEAVKIRYIHELKKFGLF